MQRLIERYPNEIVFDYHARLQNGTNVWILKSITPRPGELLPKDHQTFWTRCIKFGGADALFNLLPCYFAEYTGAPDRLTSVRWILTDAPVTEEEDGFPNWVGLKDALDKLEPQRNALSSFF